jgi:chromosome segregation ATPase
MTEVSDVKTEPKSNDMSDDAENRTCSLCQRVFKDAKTRKAHERSCRRKKEESIGALAKEDPGGDIAKLREELMTDFEAIKEERLQLAEERRLFRVEMERAREERADMNSHGESLEFQEQEMAADEAGVETLEEMDKELERIEPEAAEVGEGVTEVDLEHLTMELESIESELNTKVDMEALTKMSEDYGNALSRLEEGIDATNRKIDNVVIEMDESGRRFGTYQSMVREMKKLDDKTTEILEEIGFGESLNVSKIPPNILESVYDSTIEDIVLEISRNFGVHDAENIISRTLEDIRTRTSGSELFYYDGRVLRTRNLARAIQNKLISAKQVQTTYDELLRKLLEYLPGFKAKNFRAMIKLKSQEFAVDKTSHLLETFQSFTEDMNGLRMMLGNVTNRQNSIERTMGTIMESKVSREELQEMRNLFEEVKVKQGELIEAMTAIREQMEKSESEDLESIKDRLEALEKNTPKAKRSSKNIEAEKVEPESEIAGITAVLGGLSADEEKIVRIIPSNGFTETRIKKELCEELSEDRIDECLKILVEKGFVSTVRRGRHTIFMKKKETEANGGERSA